MAEKIKFFKLTREIYETAGIHLCKSTGNGSFNLRNSFILIMLSVVFIVSTVFLLFDAKTIEEYGNSFYISTTVFLDVFMWTSLIPKMGDLFNLMDQMNEFSQKRKSKNLEFLLAEQIRVVLAVRGTLARMSTFFHIYKFDD